MAAVVARIAAPTMVVVCLFAAYGAIAQVAALGDTKSMAVGSLMVLLAICVTVLMYLLLGWVRTRRWVWRVLEGWTACALVWGVTMLAWPTQHGADAINPEQAEFDRFATPWLLAIWIAMCGLVLISFRYSSRARGGPGAGA